MQLSTLYMQMTSTHVMADGAASLAFREDFRAPGRQLSYHLSSPYMLVAF